MKIFTTSFYDAKILAFSLFFCLPMVATAQVLFTQDFSSSTTLSTYVGTGANQFDFIGVTGSGSSSVYATGNRLNLQRNTNNLGFVKTTALSPTPSILRIKFKFSVPFSSGTTATPTAAVFYVGSGLTAAATTTGEITTPTNGSRHSSLLIGFAATSGTFNLRTPAFATSASNYTGEQDISWYINNSGAAVNYVGPNGISTALADDMADVWVGTSIVFSAIPAVTPSQDLTNFKFLFNNAASNTAIAIDNLEISTGATALPVALTSFTANKLGAANQLTWATESETNNKGYDVERQNANGTWASLGFVNGAGKAATYTFEDKDPLSISYYRLRQVDFDGTETLSKVVSVSQNTKGRMSISPNPTSDKVNISLNQNDVSNQTTTLVLSDMTGRQVLTQTTTADAFQLDLSNLAKGMYVVTLQSNNAIYQEKIIRQ